MDSTPEEWKSLFPMSSVFNPPLLCSNSNPSVLGPLIFKPKPNTTTILYSSRRLLPPPVTPLPHLSLTRFLAATSPDSAPLPSTSSSIASFLSPNDEYSNPLSNVHNCLEFLQCPQTNSILIFFPTGEIANQVGFLELVLEGSTIHVKVSNQQSISEHRISRISAIPVSNFRGNGPVTIGYLLASTMNCVHWFTVQVGKSESDPDRASLHNVVDSHFLTSCVVHACWNPHILGESVVLLENGALYLVDLESYLNNSSSADSYLEKNKLKVHWPNNGSGSSQNSRWLSCEFSWNHRLLIIARSDAVFLVDFSSKLCILTCLMKIETLHMYASIEKEQFHVLSKVGSDSFHFVLVSDHLLLLCDVRKPLMPVLQWAHGLGEPTYADVYRLSELRSYSKCDRYNWSSDSGFCIIVGSFWNCEFSTFCYGPSLPTPIGSVASKVTEFKKYFCAWELPSAILLSGDECHCGSCLVRDEFSKDALPEWIDWQHKKEIVLGFGVVNKDLSTLNSEPDEFGGFTVIRLMSSGKLELQRYCASWDPVKQVEESHRRFKYKDHLLYSPVEEYRFSKKYKYQGLDYLYGYLDGSLDEVLDAKMKTPSKDVRGKKPFSPEFHEILCKKLHDCGCSQLRQSPAIAIFLNDVSLPASIHEVVLRRLWSGLPMELLQLAFSNYTEFSEVRVDQKKVSLKFAVVPDLSQLPPFLLRRPNKWSKKVQPGYTLVGPVLPLPLLLGLHEYRNGCPNSKLARFSVEAELSLNCDEVMQVVCEMAASTSVPEMTDDQVIFDDDDGGEEKFCDSQKSKSFFLYLQAAAKDSSLDHKKGKSVYKDDRFDTFILKLSEKKQASSEIKHEVGLELFDDLCPAKLKFDACSMKFEQKEMESYNLLKSQLVEWQNGFDLYTEFHSQIPSAMELN